MKPRYKICYRSNENIWNDKTLYKLKRKKWKMFLKSKRKHKLTPIVYKQKQFNTQRPKSTKQLYKQRLLARQMFKSFYGDLTDKFLKKSFNSMRQKNSYNVMNNLILLLEHRLDIILYRLGLATSIFHAKQLIQHKKIFVNQEICHSRNYIVKPGDILKLNTDTNTLVLPKILPYIESHSKLNLFIFLRSPKLNEIRYPFRIQPNLIFEYLNKS